LFKGDNSDFLSSDLYSAEVWFIFKWHFIALAYQEINSVLYKRLSLTISVAAVLALSGLGVNVKTASLKMMPAEAQVCIKSENFSLVVASTNGIALRSATRLDARTSETVAFQQTVDFDGWTYGETITDLWGSKDALWFRLRGRDRWVPSGYMRGFPPSKPSPTSGATPTCSDNTSNPQDFRPVNFSGRAYVGGANIRSATSLSASIVRRAQSEERLNFDGWTYGERVRDEASGQLDARWYRLSGQNLWVASAVVNGNAPGSTPLPPESPQTGQISLPFASGQTWYVCQGYNGTVSHRGYPAALVPLNKETSML
jgi:hypothetical protein